MGVGALSDILKTSLELKMMGQELPRNYFIHSIHYLHLETPTSYH